MKTKVKEWETYPFRGSSLVALLVFCLSCAKTERNTALGLVPTIHVDVEEVEMHQTDRLSDIFEPLGAIILETTSESLIQTINKLEFYDNNIYVLDSYGSKSLLVFSRDGKYKYKIGRTGNGPGEYMEPKDFEINENEIRILSYNKLVVYSLSGQFKRNVRLGFAAEDFTSISPEYDAYYGAAKEDRIIVADKNGQKKYSSFGYSPKNRLVTSFLIQKCDSNVLFNIPYHNTILKVDENHVSEYCHIDFGDATFTNESYLNISPNRRMDIADYVYESNRYAFNGFYSEAGFFRIVQFVYKKKTFCCIQSKNTGERICYNLLTNTDDLWYSRTFALPVKILNDNRLIFVQNYPSELISGKKKLEEAAQKSDLSDREKGRLEELTNICNQITEMSNPVILIARIDSAKFSNHAF